MRRRFLFLFSLVWLVPIVAQGDYFLLQGDIMEGAPRGGDLRPGAFAMTHGLAIVETPTFGSDTGLAGLNDELPGMGSFGRGTPPPTPTVVRLPFGERLTTHLLHFELPEGIDGSYAFSGRVFFDAEIVAILWTDEGLYGTDAPPIGAGFLQWSEDGRRVELEATDTDGDMIVREPGNTSLSLELRVGPSDPIDQIRVITLGEPPDANVFIECDSALVTEGDGRIVLEGNVVNDGMETSLPVALRVTWNPDRTELPGGGLTLDGTMRTCDGMSPATCGLGRVDVGSHRLRADIVGAPGETIGVDVMLVGPGTTNTICHLEGTVPALPMVDAGTAADAGEPIPADIIPSFHGGGGCVCEVGSTSPSTPATWALFAALGLLLVSRRR